MLQLTQNLRDGQMSMLDLPIPIPGPGKILVRNHYSVISTGTEGRTVADARKGMLAKARARREDLDKVIRLARRQGWIETYKTVMRRLEAPVPLGYSCAGEVIGLGDGVTRFRIGDRVACAGSTANHAEVIAVPVNLCVSIPESVSYEKAVFSTLAAIAMQGLRQARVEPGGYVAVLGLGLIGLLTVQLLRASGIRSIAIDIREEPLKTAVQCGASLALSTQQPGLLESVQHLTAGIGVDAVIITASSQDTDAVNLAGELCRAKGAVVVVGAVPTGFNRKQYYRKELDLRMSCSYGPGRYDPLYEEQGIDYPPAYVRWTENRNMQAYMDLVADEKLDPSLLISHNIPFEKAVDAYQMILDRKEEFYGILFKYSATVQEMGRIHFPQNTKRANPVRVAVIGTGNYAQNIMLPILKEKCDLSGVVSMRGHTGYHVAQRYGFSFASVDPLQVLDDPETDAVFILTRHDSHAQLAAMGLSKGKHVFVEKPLSIDEEGLKELRIAWETAPSGTIIHTGFNRRFAPMTRMLADSLPVEVPRAISMRISAGKLPPDHWAHNPKEGGGRILGELCHFVDLALVLAGSPVKTVFANVLDDAFALNDSLCLNLQMYNGSIASISYQSNGHPDLPKELIEVSAGGVSGRIMDFKRIDVWGKKHIVKSTKRQDKGHNAIVTHFLEVIKSGLISPFLFEDQWNVTSVGLAALRSLQENRPIQPERF